jgi:hypothetical protein
LPRSYFYARRLLARFQFVAKYTLFLPVYALGSCAGRACAFDLIRAHLLIDAIRGGLCPLDEMLNSSTSSVTFFWFLCSHSASLVCDIKLQFAVGNCLHHPLCSDPEEPFSKLPTCVFDDLTELLILT